MSDSLKGVWAVLQEIKGDLKTMDAKWEKHLAASSAHYQVLNNLSTQVDHLEKILTRGNGQKPVLSRLEGLHKDVESLKAEQGSLRNEHEALKQANNLKLPEEAQAEATKARWYAIAKIAGVFAVLAPGLLALLGVRI